MGNNLVIWYVKIDCLIFFQKAILFLNNVVCIIPEALCRTFTYRSNKTDDTRMDMDETAPGPVAPSDATMRIMVGESAWGRDGAMMVDENDGRVDEDERTVDGESAEEYGWIENAEVYFMEEFSVEELLDFFNEMADEMTNTASSLFLY